MKTGIIHGRFQVFHNGHLEYALQAKAACDYLIVGITNPDIYLTKNDDTHPARSKAENNPFTYYERLLMIREALMKVGLKRTEFEIVPFPINFPELLSNYIPSEAIHFTRVYENWNRKKIQLLEHQGYEVVVLHEDIPENKTHTMELPIGGLGKPGIVLIEEGRNVRRRMLEDNRWEQYVPEGTATVIKQLGLIERLRK
ncbi:MAG: adenylyltransferase/cytidyltransferase family protein [Candidatus Saccharimonadales bacterium]